MLTLALTSLEKLIVASLGAGIGVAVVFSVAVLGVTRSGDLRRERRSGPAAAWGVLGLVGLLLSAALVVLGIFLVAHKS